MGLTFLLGLLDRCILDPVPDFGTEVALVDVSEEFDAF